MIRSLFKPRQVLTYLLALLLTLGFIGENARVFAIPDPDFYSGNDIIYYDPDFQTACALGGGALTGNSTKEKIWNFLIANELTPEQAAGLMGNMQKESNFIPTNWQGGESSGLWDSDGGEGWGLVQWDSGRRYTSPNGGVLGTLREEKPHLVQYTEYQYQSIGEPNAEFPQADFDEMLLFLLDYMMQESIARPVTADQFSGSADKEWERMKEQPSLRDATLFWERNFEVSGDINYPERLQQRVDFAEAIYDEFKDNLNAAGTGTSRCAAAGSLQELTLAYAWPQYENPPFPQKKPAYAEAVQTAISKGLYVGTRQSGYEGVDCGGFVTLLVTNSGHDPRYNYDGAGGNTTDQKRWLEENWDRVGIGGADTSSKIRPGDVAIAANGETNHTYIYVGEITDFGGNNSTPGIASASISYTGESWRAPMAGRESLTDPTYTWYSKKD